MGLNLLIIGQTGQLARALADVIATTDHTPVFVDRQAFDLSNPPRALYDALKGYKRPDVLILAAAYTAVDQAENDQETAFAVNARAPETIAKYCADIDVPLVHISTDYVFRGHSKEPYREEDPTDPISVYGQSKLAGEHAIINSGTRAAILRTSWVFDGTGKNFLTTMLGLVKDRDNLNIVDDQIGRPTFAGHLAQATLVAAEALHAKNPAAKGIFHVSGTGEPISWAQFADVIFEKSAEVDKTVNITGIPSVDYPTPAARPKYSVLDSSKFAKTFGYTLPEWAIGLREALAERSKGNT